MLFNSIDFLIFFPIVLLVYYLIPNKYKYIWLLVSSYYFYMCWNAKYAILIFTSTIITYLCGLFIERIILSEECNKKRTVAKLIVLFGITSNLAILFYFKYFNFAISLLEKLFSSMGLQMNMPSFDIILPVGISFYTFQALGYILDVYWGRVRSEKNFLRYALFVSFFPQLVAGPIERSKRLIEQLNRLERFDFYKIRKGFLTMLWGYFIKIVVADRIAIFVDTIYGDYREYTGYYLILATILFAFQIYCDFAGYSIIAKGAASVIGVELMDNFSAPYLSTSVATFWRNWHISLTSWFRDYVYIPLGGNRKGKFRKYINLLIVFGASGLWHGADLSFVLWGVLNAMFQIVGECLQPVRKRLLHLLKLNSDSLGHKLARVIVTFILVDFTWIFFRADNIHSAIGIIYRTITVKNPWILFDGSIYQCGLDVSNFWIMIAGIVVIFWVDLINIKGYRVIDIVIGQDYWFRWLIVSFSIAIILTFGIWGTSYNDTNFIYFQF